VLLYHTIKCKLSKYLMVRLTGFDAIFATFSHSRYARIVRIEQQQLVRFAIPGLVRAHTVCHPSSFLHLGVMAFGPILSEFLLVFGKHGKVDLHEVIYGSRSRTPHSNDALQNSPCWLGRHFVLTVCGVQVLRYAFLNLGGLYSPHSR
jgi:hypothetical protein